MTQKISFTTQKGGVVKTSLTLHASGGLVELGKKVLAIDMDPHGNFVEKMVGIGETRRKQFIALLKLPENIQKDIVAIGRRPAQNMITEKHARALLMLNNYPQKQIELFELIKNSEQPITGDDAINKAKQIKGKNSLHIFRVTYRTEEELIRILEEKLGELRRIREEYL